MSDFFEPVHEIPAIPNNFPPRVLNERTQAIIDHLKGNGGILKLKMPLRQGELQALRSTLARHFDSDTHRAKVAQRRIDNLAGLNDEPLYEVYVTVVMKENQKSK